MLWEKFHKNTSNVIKKVPLLISIPGSLKIDQTTNTLFEMVDLLPTLVDLTGLPSLPRCPHGLSTGDKNICSEGISLASIFAFDEEDNDAALDDFIREKTALAQIQKGHDQMGYSLYTRDFRHGCQLSFISTLFITLTQVKTFFGPGLV